MSIKFIHRPTDRQTDDAAVSGVTSTGKSRCVVVEGALRQRGYYVAKCEKGIVVTLKKSIDEAKQKNTPYGIH